MKSIKPGRGPSMMGVIIGIAVVLFGIFWTVIAASMGAFIMIPFGIIFIIIAVVSVTYNYKNATGDERFSEYDIVDEDEEPDPFNKKFGKSKSSNETSGASKMRYCPYCGEKISAEHKFCGHCGAKLTDDGGK